MKQNNRTLSIVLAGLILSAGVVAIVPNAIAQPAPNVVRQTDGVPLAPMPKIDYLGADSDEEVQGAPAGPQAPGPQTDGVPGDTGNAPAGPKIPVGPDGVPGLNIPGLHPGAVPNGQPQTVEVEPTPAMREALYKRIWGLIANQFLDETKLKDWDQRLHKYDGKLNTEEDLDAALKDLVGSVNDRWTQYKSGKEQYELAKKLQAGLVPAGLLLRKHADGKMRIDSLMYASAAYASTLREGDIILSINGKKLDKLNDDQALALTMGEPGEKMTVVALYDGKEHEVVLDLFPPMKDRVSSGILPDEILYIRLPTFMDAKYIDQFADQLRKQYMEKKGAITGIVFDLRNNGGGLVDQALKVSSFFLQSGTITKTKTHNGQMETVTDNNVRPMPPFAKTMMTEPHMLEFIEWMQNTPMVVLINGSTASSSEITTGALQDNGRAFVIGTHSFGKSVAFMMEDLPNGGRFFMTTLKYLTPNGHDLIDKGIQPDLVVEQPRGGKEDLALKAAHDHIVKVATERSKQLQDAQEIVQKPASDLKSIDNGDGSCRLPWKVLGLIGLIAFALVSAFFLAQHDSRPKD